MIKKLLLAVMLFSFFLACQNQLDTQTKLFEKDYKTGIALLDSAQIDMDNWNYLEIKLFEHPDYKSENPEIIRMHKDLKRFRERLETYRNELRGWNNMTNDFSTMKSKNVKKMSEMRLKDVKDINKNIRKFTGTGNRIYIQAKQTYFPD